MALPVCRWYLTSITDEQFDWGIRITVTTDVAVHLYMRHSDNFPRIHAATREHRGVVMWGGVYHCFTAYHHIEQNEEGDTTVHITSTSLVIRTTSNVSVTVPFSGFITTGLPHHPMTTWHASLVLKMT